MASRSIICRSLRQITDLRDTDKAITKFDNCFIIRSPSLFSYLNHSDSSGKRSAIFHARAWLQLRMSRPLFVGSYLLVTWWALGQWHRRKNASNYNAVCFFYVLEGYVEALVCTKKNKSTVVKSCMRTKHKQETFLAS